MHSSLQEVAAVFSRLGMTAFGGPAAHIAMMRNELVERRRWLSDGEFIDLLGITSLIPGPNSTEMALHLGLKRAGLRGLLVAGVCFIGPAMLIVLALAWAYVRYGTLPQAKWLLDGLTPVILAIVAQALWFLGRTALHAPRLVAVALAVLLGFALGVHELILLVAGAALAWIWAFPGRAQTLLVLLPLQVAQSDEWSLTRLGLIFLKIGSVLYGSGYVLLAFLQSDLVDRLGWLTSQQLLDAIAVGQLTPGPVFTTATFIGYILGAPHGVGGAAALVATIGIFAPSFVFVALTQPLLRRLQQSTSLRILLDGVNAASWGLMAAVTAELALTTFQTSLLPGWVIVLMIISALIALLRYRLNTTWLLAAGAITGFVGFAIH